LLGSSFLACDAVPLVEHLPTFRGSLCPLPKAQWSRIFYYSWKLTNQWPI